MQQAEQLVFDAGAYLAWEENETEKHEFIAGEVFAMVGARREHVVVSGNIFAALKQRLRGKPCLAYIADMKLHVKEADAFFYPDVMVSCHAEDSRAEQFLSYPTLIVEVLSDSTEAFDRGVKFAAYRQLESLQEYVLVDLKAKRLECFRRTEEGDWLLHDAAGDECCDFKSLNLSIPMAEIFEDVDDAS